MTDASPKETKQEAKPKYVISIDFGSSKAKGTGDTMLQALEDIKTPVKIVGKTFLTATCGKRKADMMMLPAKAKRFLYPNSRLYMAKNLELLLR